MTFDAIVIGGGCAGFAAATALVEAGARVLVVEARPGLGGRATAFTDPSTGERVDNGQHILMGCYTETLAFLDRIETLTEHDRLVVHRVAGDQEHAAWEWLRKHDERVYSFVDATSFRVMRDRRLREALAFDQDFAAAGFIEVRPR